MLSLGPVQVRYYGVLFAFGLMMAANTGTHFFKKQNYDPDDIDSAVLWMILGIIVGAHWVHLIFYEMILMQIRVYDFELAPAKGRFFSLLMPL